MQSQMCHSLLLLGVKKKKNNVTAGKLFIVLQIAVSLSALIEESLRNLEISSKQQQA